MIESEERERVMFSESDSPLIVISRSLAGAGTLGLLGVLAAPVIAIPTAVTVVLAALTGLIGGYYAKKLDKN